MHMRPVSYVGILAWTGPRTASLFLEKILSCLTHDFLTSMWHDFGVQSPTRLLSELETISQASLRRAMEELLQERPGVVVLGPHRKGFLRLRDMVSAHFDSRRQTSLRHAPRSVPSR